MDLQKLHPSVYKELVTKEYIKKYYALRDSLKTIAESALISNLLKNENLDKLVPDFYENLENQKEEVAVPVEKRLEDIYRDLRNGCDGGNWKSCIWISGLEWGGGDIDYIKFDKTNNTTTRGYFCDLADYYSSKELAYLDGLNNTKPYLGNNALEDHREARFFWGSKFNQRITSFLVYFIQACKSDFLKDEFKLNWDGRCPALYSYGLFCNGPGCKLNLFPLSLPKTRLSNLNLYWKGTLLQENISSYSLKKVKGNLEEVRGNAIRAALRKFECKTRLVVLFGKNDFDTLCSLFDPSQAGKEEPLEEDKKVLGRLKKVVVNGNTLFLCAIDFLPAKGTYLQQYAILLKDRLASEYPEDFNNLKASLMEELKVVNSSEK